MDWSKAKTILIIALIITDIFLVFTYGIDREANTELKNEAALVSILESNDIFVDAEIPDGHDEMAVLAVEYKDVSEQEIEALISAADIKTDGSREESYKEAALEFIRYLGMESEYAVIDKVVTDERQDTAAVEFVCKVEDFYLDGSYMICTFKGDKLTGLESHWLEPVDFSYRELETISASVALLSFMSDREEESGTTHISDIEMVYWVNDLYETDAAVSDTALPAWRITLGSGEIFHIEAFEREGRSE